MTRWPFLARRRRNTLGYGIAPASREERIDLAPAAAPSRPTGTLYVPPPRRSPQLRRAAAVLGLGGLLAVAALCHQDRLGALFDRMFPPDGEFASDEPIPDMLFVRSTPSGARVYINGRLAGTTPLAQGTSSRGGKMQVRIEAQGWKPWVRTITLDSAGVRLTARLVPGRTDRHEPPLVVARLFEGK